MSKSDNAQKNSAATYSRPWLDAFPYEALASREQHPDLADADLNDSLPDGCVVAYVDERLRTHVMEARAYGLTTGNRRLLVGFQIDGALVERLTWKSVERYDRIFVIERNIELPARTVPTQHASRFIEIFALAPETALDLTRHEAEGY